MYRHRIRLIFFQAVAAARYLTSIRQFLWWAQIAKKSWERSVLSWAGVKKTDIEERCCYQIILMRWHLKSYSRIVCIYASTGHPHAQRERWACRLPIRRFYAFDLFRASPFAPRSRTFIAAAPPLCHRAPLQSLTECKRDNKNTSTNVNVMCAASAALCIYKINVRVINGIIILCVCGRHETYVHIVYLLADMCAMDGK